MRNNIDTFLFSETKLDEKFSNQQYKISDYEMFSSIDANMAGVL